MGPMAANFAKTCMVAKEEPWRDHETWKERKLGKDEYRADGRRFDPDWPHSSESGNHAATRGHFPPLTVKGDALLEGAVALESKCSAKAPGRAPRRGPPLPPTCMRSHRCKSDTSPRYEDPVSSPSRSSQLPQEVSGVLCHAVLSLCERLVGARARGNHAQNRKATRWNDSGHARCTD